MKCICILVAAATLAFHSSSAALTLIRQYDATSFNTNAATLADTSGQGGSTLTAGSGTGGAGYGLPVRVASGAGPHNRAYLDFRNYGVMTGGDSDSIFTDPGAPAGSQANGYTMEGYLYFSSTLLAPGQNMGIGVNANGAIQSHFVVIKTGSNAADARCGQTQTADASGNLRYLTTSFYNDVALPLPLDQWVHVVKVHDPATDNVRWYVNGTLAVTQNDWTPASSTGYFDHYHSRVFGVGNVGETGREVGGNGGALSGLGYSFMRFYRGAATVPEVEALYDAVAGAFVDPYVTWASNYFGCTACPQAAGNADPYGKGISNTNQFLAGFNPTNTAANPRITKITITNSGDVNVSFHASNGDASYTGGPSIRTNILEYATDVGPNNFFSTGQAQILSNGNGTGILTNLIDYGAGSEPRMFYRVRMLGLTQTGPSGSGVMSTRGFARTSELGSGAGKEAITSFRFELPYGVSSGWKLPYLGFSDGPTNAIDIVSVVVTIAEPSTTNVLRRVTFSGQNGTSVAANAVVESDPVPVALLPGTVLTVGTFYRNHNPASPPPYLNWGFTEQMDGCLAGDIGTLSESSLWDDSVYRGSAPPAPLNAGIGALIRSYEPMFVTGKPHPSYIGQEVVVGFIGDSINIAQNDLGRATVGDPYPARGWNGRYCGVSKPYVVFGQSGSNAGGFINAQGTPVFNYIFGTGNYDRKVTHLVDAYGINTLRQPTSPGWPGSVWSNRQQVASITSQLGILYVHTTLTPMAAGWLAADTNTYFAAFVAARATFNGQVRTTSGSISNCVAFIDWGTSVETDPGTNNNIWDPAIGTDGIHPDHVGHDRMSGAVGNPFTTPNPLP